MEKLRAAVNEFDRFQNMMRQKNRYDFDDMINWVITAFESNKNLLANYQERFQYILVDEYQDTSGTQNRLVELLISYWDKPNVFVVGDDDQSIYRFQGANVENMLGFAESYKNRLNRTGSDGGKESPTLPLVIRVYEADGVTLDLRSGLLTLKPPTSEELRAFLLAMLPLPDEFDGSVR